MEGLTPGSWFELTFNDRSTVTISGNSTVTFADHGQKTLYLREGSLSSHVTAQPQGKPMLVYTRSALLEVLGTQFEVQAEQAATILNVSEGEVRVKRLSDGTTVKVKAKQRVVAADDRELQPVPVPEAVGRWKSQLHVGPEGTYGKWSPTTAMEEAKLETIPLTIPQGLTIYAAAVGVSHGDRPPVILQPGCRVRVRGHMASTHEVYFGVNVRYLSGGFAGRFQTVRPALEFQSGQDFEGILLLGDFRLDPLLVDMKDKLPSTPFHLVVESIWCHTLDHPSGLEITEVALLPPATSVDPAAAESLQPLSMDIWAAASQGDLHTVKRHLAGGIDIDEAFVAPGIPASGATPLHMAILSDQQDVARFLIDQGANINAPAQDEYGGTPLHWAAVLGRVEMARQLIDAGANVNITSNDGATALHGAAFFCHNKIVKLLLDKGAVVSAKNIRGETPLDAVAGDWSQELEGIYTWIADLLGLQVDLERIKTTRPKVAALLRKADAKATGQRKQAATEVKSTGYRGSYFMNGEIHVNTYGTPERKPLTSGHQDFKPSWSKTGDMLVFFRRLKNHRVTVMWKTAIHIINVDGTGLHQLTDGTHTDFNQTWTRDGTNTPIWNRKNPATGSFYVMKSRVGAKPGEEVALTDKHYHTWAYTCLMDGRILVQCAHPKQGHGYYLMTPHANGKPRFKPIGCAMATRGILDRVSISPSETRICFEYQTGFKYKDAGRTLYIADFDASKPSITNAKAFANEGRADRWFAYPRWTKDEKAIVYHASPSLYLYTLKDGSTRQVSTTVGADYRYPHMEATPK